ncbi:hypothetical protein D3C79_774970 [compost metagenome]
MLAQQLGQQLDVVLSATDVVACFVVAGFSQRCHGVDGDVLDGGHLAGAALHFLLQEIVLVAQEVRSCLDLDLCLNPGQEDRRDDRLGDVIRSPQAKPANFVLGSSHGGQENDRDVAGTGGTLELLGNIVARQARHHDVKQDQVGECVALQ